MACYDPAPEPLHRAQRQRRSSIPTQSLLEAMLVLRVHRSILSGAVVLLAIGPFGLSTVDSLAQGDAVVLNTPDEGKSPRPIQCRPPGHDEAVSQAVEQAARRRGSSQQRADLLRQSASAERTFIEWEASMCDALQHKKMTPAQYVSLVDEVLPKVSTLAALPRAQLLEPKNGAVLDVYPRRTLVSWKQVAGAAQYLVEVQYRAVRVEHAGDGSARLEEVGWEPHNDGLHSALVSGTSAAFHFIGMQRGRVRVRPLTEAGNSGPPSEWREFRYTK